MAGGAQLRAVWGLVGGYVAGHTSAIPLHANTAEQDGAAAARFFIGAMFVWFAVGFLMKPKS
jgi:hypothetical protein